MPLMVRKFVFDVTKLLHENSFLGNWLTYTFEESSSGVANRKLSQKLTEDKFLEL